MDADYKANLIVYGGVVVSVVSTVSLVLLNKWIFERDGFQFMATLTGFHFGFTYLATRLLLGADFFEYKEPEGGTAKVIPVAIGSLCSVLFMNMNLAYNSVVFYQVSKIGCVPMLLLLQHWLYGTSISHKTRICQTILLAGIAMAFLSDPTLNATGATFAVVSVFATVIAQILTNKKQKDLQLNPMQLLYHASPFIFGGMVVCIPVFDSLHEIGEFCTGAHMTEDADQRMLTAPVMGRILLSCFLALLVNISNYLLIGKATVLIQQLMNHAKTILVLVFGFSMFTPHTVTLNLLGVVLALVGTIGYAEVKRRTITKSTAPSLGAAGAGAGAAAAGASTNTKPKQQQQGNTTKQVVASPAAASPVAARAAPAPAI